MSHYPTFTSRIVPLLINDIDTDQIIPARFLKVTDKAGLGDNLFADWRYLPNGAPNPEFVLNNPQYKGTQVLLAGNNFGCGSSREHAPWALCGFGFRAVISSSFADIFRNNALKNGLLPIEVSAEIHCSLTELIKQKPDTSITISLDEHTITYSGKSISFAIDEFARYCLLNGVDELGYILRFEDDIKSYELSHNV